MSRLTREARKAYFRGDYLRAGDLYKAAGYLKKALKMYLKAGDRPAAAKVQEELGDTDSAVSLLLEVGELDTAASILADNRKYSRAAKLFADAGQPLKAAMFAEKGGNSGLAAAYYEKAGKFWEAGLQSDKAGKPGKAMLFMEKAIRQFPDEALLSPSEKEVWRERKALAAASFERGQSFERAAQIFQTVGLMESAGRCLEKGGYFTDAMRVYESLGYGGKVRDLAQKEREVRQRRKAAGLPVQEKEPASQEENVEQTASQLEQSGQELEAARLYRDSGDWERAANLFYKAGAFEDAGKCFETVYQYALARQCYEKIGLKGHAMAMALEAGEWENAVDLAGNDSALLKDLIQKLQSAASSREEPHRTAVLKARAFLELGNPDVVLEILSDLPGGANSDPWPDYLKARALEALDRRDEAVTHYKRIVAKDLGFRDAATRLSALERFSPGQERYQKTNELFEDHTGVWYEGEDTHLGLPVLMHLLEVSQGNTALIRRYANELKKLVGLFHPAILGLRDVLYHDQGLILVHEYFEGDPLEKKLGEGYVPTLFDTVDIVRQVLEGLKQAHEYGVIHRQLCPANVLLGVGPKVKLWGFSMARRLTDLESTPRLKRDVMPYLSPEVLVGETQSKGSDLYSSGAILYRLLFGEPPRWSDSETRFEDMKGKPIPDLLKNILKKLMHPDPDERYADAQSVLSDLSAMELTPGAVVAGRYEILDELGRGGMGQVYRVRDIELDEIIALKTLKGRTGFSESTRNRFLREIKLARKITHSNVVRVFDLGTWRDLIFLTMEYVPGPTLNKWVGEPGKLQHSLGDKVKVLKGVASGLDAAHRLGIIHRDLKPQNVILTSNVVPKILDFGIAYTDEGAELTQEGHFVGSPRYVSPEQVQGKELDARSDVYCFGLLAYFLLTGEDAFQGENSTQILLAQLHRTPPPVSSKVRVPESLEKLLTRCLNKKMQDRPGSMREVLSILEEMA
ncbi:MAG: protein kinase [Acidobacteriota bacterium]